MNTKALQERVKLFYKLATYGDRASFLQSIGQQIPIPKVPEGMEWTPIGVVPKGSLNTAPTQINLPEQVITGNPPNPNAPQEIINLPEQVITGTPPAQSYMLPIGKDVQGQLSDLLMPKGLIAVKLDEDGKIGPKTRQALVAFKQHYNLPATPQNIKAVWLKERNPELETKFPE